MNSSKQDVLVSGKTSFKIEVPYELIEVGSKGDKKPLIIYLHGFGQNNKLFKKLCKPLIKIPAYHLFIQGPYPLYDKKGNKNVSDWGRAWYLYDGNRGQFIKSLEISSEFVQEIVDKLLTHINVSRICLFGYSMGGYLAGYFSLTRWKHVNELIVVGARIKTEVLNNNWDNIQHLQILALHGKNDKSVDYEPQNDEINLLRNHNVKSDFVLVQAGHKLEKTYFDEILNWLEKRGYYHL